MFTKARLSKLAAVFVLAVSIAACAAIAERETPGEYVDDTTITAQVMAAIVKDPMLKKNQVSVETFQRVVQLSGFVDTADGVSRAASLARGVKGVRSVTNNLIVVQPM